MCSQANIEYPDRAEIVQRRSSPCQITVEGPHIESPAIQTTTHTESPFQI